MSTYKQIFKRLLAIFIIDVILLALLVWWIDATPDVSIAELIIAPAILVANLIIAGAIYLLKTKIDLAIAFLINSVIAPIIFHVLFGMWFTHYDSTHFKSYYFSKNSKNYEITLFKEDTSFDVSDISNKGSSIEFMRGNYKITKDGIDLLADSMKKMVIINNKLIGYPTSKDTIQLR